VEPINDALREAFQFLQSVVTDLRTTGRKGLGAFLKPEMFRRSYGRFDEKRLGFLKFRDFVMAAEKAGYVTITRSVIGPDFEVWPQESVAGPPLPASAAPPASINRSPQQPLELHPEDRTAPSNVTVRPDLWDAFTNFSPGYLRFFDIDVDRAYRILKQVGYLEEQAVRQYRERLSANDNRLVSISPVGREQLTEWMRSFAEKQDGDLRISLLAAVDKSSNPIHEFETIIRSRPGLFRVWHGYRVDKVISVITAWAAQNQLTVRSLTKPFPPQARPARFAFEVPAQASESKDIVVARMVPVIDEVIEELLKLRGALQYLNSRR